MIVQHNNLAIVQKRVNYVQAHINFDSIPEEISFKVVTHIRENNNESEQNLYEHRKHFNNQLKKLYELLMAGNRLTVYSALVEHKIASLPRRYLDLTQAGRKAQAVQITGTRIKEYFMLPEEIKYNRERFGC